MIRASRSPRGVAVGILALAAGALLLGHGLLPDVDGTASLVETFLPWVGLLILLLGLAAVVRLSLFGGLCVAVAAAIWASQFLPAALPRTGAGAPSLTVASENIRAGNRAAGAIARDLASRQPDVIVLQELDATSRRTIAGVLATAYPDSAVVGTVGVWSRFPLTHERPLDLGLGWDRALSVDVQGPGASTRLYAVHLASVRIGRYLSRDTMLTQLSATVKTDPSPRLLVVGDFNTASTDRTFKPLLSELTEAPGSALGFGFTWPAAFPVARLDHALVRGLTTLSNSVLPDNGSDHRGILVSLR